jgi:hypothetical protein
MVVFVEIFKERIEVSIFPLVIAVQRGEIANNQVTHDIAPFPSKEFGADPKAVYSRIP